ncbi:N-acetylmuramic acid 6-phosphate etherase [Rhodobacteraceae bacterium 2376]|uniref:N-acetylmuramic acid 6-phosphate etherase n=1 Tax=Rhabdonatronobacter sediminivivens TaxID=2743469 RepID=A0A7Z0I0T3_9RHOB|nr:N-acetylmuramic acid 6-phosphate etherase [Rhabdonatronobacter sediminivivens]NYS25454.1 N-acetylmuramic acid 6-phosphate etherase [Rhabdonatronobacter sediminivivens]
MTEFADPRYASIDLWDSSTALSAIWESQIAAVAAIGPALPALVLLVEAALPRLRAGGRLVYAGAGTSIRAAVQDGTELGPTFDWPEARTVYLIAGGVQALSRGIEGAEDDTEDARAQVARAEIGPQDLVLGIAASGRTPFTLAVIRAARAAGALTAGLACNPAAPLLEAAEHAVLTDTGPEVVAGSTRMKAGTAQKVVLNMISTQIMIRLGHVHDGLMVDMRPQNAKLRGRARDMVARIAGVSDERAQAALDAADWRIKPAVLTARGMTPAQARAALARAGGVLRLALEGSG